MIILYYFKSILDLSKIIVTYMGNLNMLFENYFFRYDLHGCDLNYYV